ncbi:uncharacterized protein LOC124408110 [Diprion similis]|uniref:uncharacterized protein LOC124408110 n=1 Tax=Diprion similis TaxID=362088 RepID=UPI001EF89F03|nr:uncharacterized protein LOC124408110 [Diprion similis]
MDTRLRATKLSGVVKTYRKNAGTTTRYLKPSMLASMNINVPVKADANNRVVLQSLPHIQDNVAAVTKHPSAEEGVINAKAVKPAIATKAAMTMVKPAITAKAVMTTVKPIRPKLSKWDFKGRLAYTEQELVYFKNKLKNATTESSELTTALETLTESAKHEKERAEEAEKRYCELVKERDRLTSLMKDYQATSETLKTDVDQLKTELYKTQCSLNQHKEDYENHDAEMSAVVDNTEKMMKENSEHEETVRCLEKRNKELEIVSNGLCEKRQEMLETLKLLKGDD